MVFHFHEIFLSSMYDFEGRRAMAVYVANNVIENDTLITTAEQTEIILGLLAPLIQDQEDGPTPDKVIFFFVKSHSGPENLKKSPCKKKTREIK